MMKKVVILAVSLMTVSVMADNTAATNEMLRTWSSNHVEQQTNRFGFRQDKKRPGGRSGELAENRKQLRRLQLMERELKQIGVSEEEKAQILALQKAYREKMEANAQLVAEARKELSRLMNEGAPMEVLEAAIQRITDTQAEQLRILVRNRIEMERILGKEKHDQFMKKARSQYQKHGRAGGPPLPPRPGEPPIPGQQTVPPTPQQAPEIPGN